MFQKQFSENRLIINTLFTFFVSGATCMLMGNLMPFLREAYGISYARAGFLLSLPSWGNLASVFITGYLPAVIGRRKTILTTSVWMGLAYLCICLGVGGSGLLPVICVLNFAENVVIYKFFHRNQIYFSRYSPGVMPAYFLNTREK